MHNQLPRELYLAEQARELDRCAIEDFGIAGFTLMERAGQTAFATLQGCWPDCQKIAVFCGRGNNGGDGYIIASLAKQSGMDVTLYQIARLNQLKGDALTAAQQAEKLEIPMIDLLDPSIDIAVEADVLVDALLGTGLKGTVRNEYHEAIEIINGATSPVLAVDIPSGLCSDTGTQLGLAVKADVTVTFIGVKQGLLTGRGPALSGKIIFDGLQIPQEVYQKVNYSSQRIDLNLIRQALPPRERDAHKGRFGHVLVIAGDYGMAGAAIMAAEAAARVGAGLVSVATRAENCSIIVARRPEIMAHAIVGVDQLDPLLDKATVIVVGPGLGTTDWAVRLMNRAAQRNLPMVVDADGLRIIAEGRLNNTQARYESDNWVLTPHPGEAGRLLETDNFDIQSHRFRSASKLQERFGGTIVLKGAGTVIHSGKGHWIADVGNPGMASGGMGDVLSGVIAGLIAQGLSLDIAAQLGALLHGTAADNCALAQGERGMLATDLLPYIRRLLNGFDL